MKAHTQDRLFQLEQDVAQLRATVSSVRTRLSVRRHSQQIHMAICKELSGEYPTSGSVIPIVFVKASFLETLGHDNVDTTELHSDKHYFAKNTNDGVIPPRLTLIPVWSDNQQWWLSYSEQPAS